MAEALIDLDELVLKCKSPEARTYIAEAVKCYKVGSFRACIVSTWIALVYDFLHKLRQLELTGDGRAIDKLNEFENARNNPELALKFERSILDSAHKEFEFISDLELRDLERLNYDRNRCAHPSMLSREEIYEPPAELARYHLHSAVTHLLQHPPVQGKAALQKLQSDTLSELFPTDFNKAIEVFRHGPLANPKTSLIRNYVSSTLRTILLEPHSDRELRQLAAALLAVREMYRFQTEEILKELCSKTIERVEAQDFSRVIKLVCYVVDSWQYLNGNVRTSIETYLESLSDNHVDILRDALGHNILHAFALKSLKNLDAEGMAEIIKANPSSHFIGRAVELYGQSTNFYIANERAESLLFPLIQYIDNSHIETLFKLGAANDQIGRSFRIESLLEELVAQQRLEKTLFKALTQKYKVWEDHYSKIYDEYDFDFDRF